MFLPIPIKSIPLKRRHRTYGIVRKGPNIQISKEKLLVIISVIKPFAPWLFDSLTEFTSNIYGVDLGLFIIVWYPVLAS